jgi:hypothetical protein
MYHTPQQRQGGPSFSPGVLIGGACWLWLFCGAASSASLLQHASAARAQLLHLRSSAPTRRTSPHAPGYYEDNEQRVGAMKSFLAATMAGGLKSTRCVVWEHMQANMVKPHRHSFSNTRTQHLTLASPDPSSSNRRQLA